MKPGEAMDRKPLVSIIMIFLNEERFIQEAIDSIFAQTYECWELILVDDGSVDCSTEIARHCAAQYPEQIRFREHEYHQNRGMSASRNLGLGSARGEYIAFLDADDVWLPHKLEQEVAVLEAQPGAGMVYGMTQWWYGWTGKTEDLRRDFVQPLGGRLNSLIEPPDLVSQFLVQEEASPCTCSVLLRRTVVEAVGGFEDAFRGLYEDQAFFAKVCLATAVYAAPVLVAKYRQHPDSSCFRDQGSGGHEPARETYLNWLADYLENQGWQSLSLWSALTRERKKLGRSSLNRLMEWARRSPIGSAYRWGLRLKHGWRRLPVLRQLRAIQFRRLRPLGDGRQSGTPIVRYYWDQFLQRHRADIHGTVLEIGTTSTVLKYGGNTIEQADAMDLKAHDPEITVVSDLSRADNVPSDHYDCFVNQFTTHLIYDVEAALYHSIRLLKPGGVLLISCYELGRQPLGLASPLAFLERAGAGLDAAGIFLRMVGITVAAVQITLRQADEHLSSAGKKPFSLNGRKDLDDRQRITHNNRLRHCQIPRR